MKKRIFVLLASLALGLFFQSNVDAYAKNYLYVKKSPVNRVKIYVGGKAVKLKYNIGGRKKGIKGQWKSSDNSVIKVSKKGNCKAIDNSEDGKLVTVKFTYKQGRKKKTLKVKFIVGTKAGSVVLKNSNGETGDVIASPSQQYYFEAETTAVKSALKRDPEIETTWHTYYKTYKDYDCTEEIEGLISEDGTFEASSEGICYLRAEAKESPNSKKKVVSNVIKVTVQKSQEQLKQEEENRKAEEKRKQEEEKKKKEEEQKKLASQYKIEIVKSAPLKSMTPTNGLYSATAYYKILDGTGKEITNTGKFKASDVKVTFAVNYPPVNGQFITPQPQNVPASELGKVDLVVFNNMSGTQVNPLSVSGKLKVTLTYLGQPITSELDINFVPPVTVARAEFIGIYKCVNGVNYEKVLDKTSSKLLEGAVIGDAGGTQYINNFQGSYYILLKATDGYGNSITDMGVPASSVGLSLVSGTTGIELGTVRNTQGQTVTESINPITIDGTKYLTFPLKAATIKKGELTINSLAGPIKVKITDGSTLRMFYIRQGDTSLYAGQDNILNYDLYNSKGEKVTNYDEFVSLLGLSDPYNAGIINILPLEKTILSSAKGSTFMIKKNNGNAEIHYVPNPSSFPIYGTVVSDVYVDDITTLKGYGVGLEQRANITVTRKK